MRRPAWPLYLGLGLGGLVLGYFLGELLLTSGSGIYVGPAMAIIGLILAWMLRATQRPPDLDAPPPPVTPAPRAARPAAETGKPTVRVNSAARDGRAAGGKKGKGR